MRIHILGSAAGGGLPQWNCHCVNCRAARAGDAVRRTQSSVAVSADGKRWVLVNASPDFRAQLASFPLARARKGKLRASPFEAVVLTDGELDHVTGLLSMREEKRLRLVCSRAVVELLTRQFPLLPTLRRYARVAHAPFPARIAGLRFTALNLSCKAPPYARRPSRPDDVVALRIESTAPGRSIIYMPCLPSITERVRRFVTGCDCLLVDGTFWSDNEMIARGISARSARQMGHLPIGGPDGSLAWLRSLCIPRKIYVHINNTNPILQARSRPRKAVERDGIEIAFDGMDIQV
jgi:pyrroloquinoline quinone biosynthesis protein B